MRSKYKRKIFKKTPSLLLLLVILFALFLGFNSLLPKIFSSKTISPLGQPVHFKKDSIEDILSKNNIPFEKIKIATDSSYIIFLKDDGEVIMSSKKSIQSQVSSLHLILSRLTIEGKKFKRLDLRFERSIIEF